MKQSLDRPLAAIFTACLDYYRTNANPPQKRGGSYKQVERALTAALRAMATLHAVNYPGYEVDNDHVGYLIKLEPPMLFRVPYHVLPTFPTGNELEVLWRLSRAIRSGDRSTISISGSNVMRKIFDLVGDVDFCEYFPTDDSNGFNKLASNMDGNDGLICVKVAFADKKWNYPWGDDRPTKEFFAKMMDSSDKERSTMKVDYV